MMDPKKTLKSRSEFEHLFRVALGLPLMGNISNATSDNKYADALFVCFDFENGEKIKSHAASGSFNSRDIYAQAGISIFDPRNLLSTSSKEGLATYNFGFGECPSYRRRIDRRFFFGETIWLDQLADLLTSMEKLLDRSRNIVLVGHSLNGDCLVLRSLGFDFDSSIVGYIDTIDAAKSIFRSRSGQDKAPKVTTFRLKELLAKLGLDVQGCHIGGNDANFTLRALLLLAVESYRTSDLLNRPTNEILEKIRAIGLESLPRSLSPPTSLASKKLVRKDKDAPQQPRSESTPEYAETHRGQSFDFQQPSALLLQWCPKLQGPKKPARPV